MINPFIILSLPRSRSYWLSRLLSYNGDICRHDSVLQLRSLEDLQNWFHPGLYGVVETAGIAYWRLLLDLHPGIKVVIIKRSLIDVVNSIMTTDQPLTRKQIVKAMSRLETKLNQIASRVPNSLVLDYYSLDKEEIIEKLWNFCMPYSFPREHWLSLKGINLQVSVTKTIEYVRDNYAELNYLYNQVRQQSLFNLRLSNLHE